MKDKHFKDRLLQFIDQELPPAERQVVGKHLLHCDACRREHDALKLGGRLASTLGRQDAPDHLWKRIESGIERPRNIRTSILPTISFFTLSKAFAFGGAIIVVGLFSIAAYRGLFTISTPEIAHQPFDTPSAVAPVNLPPGGPEVPPANTSPVDPNPLNATTQPQNGQFQETIGPQWQVETLAGNPTINASSGDKLTVGAELVTDSRSRAKVEVADIGMVEVAPNSRVRLLGTSKDQHRLSLERGELHAKISAPPRLFIVETPSAAAVDLGCEYTLSVDKAGNTVLNVKTGFVALERSGRESIVPAGAMCLTNKGTLGTPFSADTSTEFRAALERFDFKAGGSTAVDEMLGARDFYDMVSLWHLLSRVPAVDRGRVFDALAGYVKPPAGVTREGILHRDRKMLEAWRVEMEQAWFN